MDNTSPVLASDPGVAKIQEILGLKDVPGIREININISAGELVRVSIEKYLTEKEARQLGTIMEDFEIHKKK